MRECARFVTRCRSRTLANRDSIKIHRPQVRPVLGWIGRERPATRPGSRPGKAVAFGYFASNSYRSGRHLSHLSATVAYTAAGIRLVNRCRCARPFQTNQPSTVRVPRLAVRFDVIRDGFTAVGAAKRKSEVGWRRCKSSSTARVGAMGKENELMNRILTSDDDGDSQPTAKQVLDDALRHVPLSIVVELVELRYRDQRNKFFLTVLGAVLTLVLGSATIGYQLYMRTEENERRREEQRRAEQTQREQDAIRADYIERLTRTETRLNFARTRQSFNVTNGSLAIDRPLRVTLGPGERKQFTVRAENEGRYRINLTEARRAQAAAGITAPVAFTPVMYLYKLRDDFVDPLATGRSSLSFDADSGTHFLEVEELLSDAGSVVITVTQLRRRDEGNESSQ